MTTFESKVNINQPLNKVYNFLADFNNHRDLMPDEVQNWSSTYNEANFSIQNMVKLALKISARIENKSIKIIPAEKPPFDIELNWSLSSNDNMTTVVFTISAELNMMMKMMASGPLQKLADHEIRILAGILD